jgi:hypothetical protein
LTLVVNVPKTMTMMQEGGSVIGLIQPAMAWKLPLQMTMKVRIAGGINNKDKIIETQQRANKP